MTPEQFEIFATIEDRHWWFVARRHIVGAVLARILRPARNQLIVDVGCGTGGNIASLALEYRCVGLDVSSDALRLARSRFPTVSFVEIGAEDNVRSHLAGAKAILCMDVIEHVERDADFLGRLVKAMDPGSVLLLTAPADMSLWSAHDETNHHFRRYSLDGFAATWSGLPVRPRLLTYFNSRLYSVVKAVRTVTRIRGRAHGAAGTDFSLPPKIINRALERFLAAEQPSIVDAVDRGTSAYRHGVSLMAVLERKTA